MSDQENKKPHTENVIAGPWQLKGERQVTLPDKDVIALRQKVKFADELSECLMVQMIHTMEENGVDVKNKEFIRDLAMVILMVEGSIYRDMDMEHEIHKFTEKYVDVEEINNVWETNINFEAIIKLSNLTEDDNEPKVS